MTIGPHERARDMDVGEDLYTAFERARLNYDAQPTDQNEFRLWRAIKALDKHCDYMIDKYKIPMSK